MVLIRNLIFDEDRFFPIFEMAQELKVPVMLHPGEVPTEVAKTYYREAGLWQWQMFLRDTALAGTMMPGCSI